MEPLAQQVLFYLEHKDSMSAFRFRVGWQRRIEGKQCGNYAYSSEEKGWYAADQFLKADTFQQGVLFGELYDH